MSIVVFGCNFNADDNRFIKITGEHEIFEQYQKAEFDIVLKGNWNNPYNSGEVALDMELISPSGRVLTLPCFYSLSESELQSHWKSRFMAQEIGVYNYRFKLYENDSLIAVSSQRTFTSILSGRKGILKPNNEWSFKYDNGEVFRGIGENICWEARTSDDNKFLKELHQNSRFNYDYLLKNLADNGGNFFRTWMIYWNLPVDWKITRNSSRYQNSNNRFNESGIKRLDELVEMCDSLNLHFMLALNAHGALMGNGWEINSYNKLQGGPAQTPIEFFALKEAREMYKDKLRFLVARWGYSPAIGAWEFFNEVDNAMFNVPDEAQIPHEVVTDWHREMSDYLKNIDPFGHLVTTSISHRDINGLNDLPSIDFNQKHIYRNTRSIPQVINEYTYRHNKPYVIGEFGYEWDWNINFNDIAKEKISDFKRGLWYGLFSPTPILPMSWWWEFFDEHDMTPYFNNIAKINKMMIESGNGQFEKFVVSASLNEIDPLTVKCGEKVFVYLFNNKKDNVVGFLNLNLKGESKFNVDVLSCEDTSVLYSRTNISDINGNLRIDFSIEGEADQVVIVSPL